jgi:hypothetical protein
MDVFVKNFRKFALCHLQSTLSSVKVENSIICFVGTQKPTVFIMERQFILLLKTLIIIIRLKMQPVPEYTEFPHALLAPWYSKGPRSV